MKVPPGNVRVIHNGADLARYQPVPAPKKPYMVWLGRIQKYKGPVDACRVLERLLPEFPGMELVIVGDGPYMPALKRHIEMHGLRDKVRITSYNVCYTKLLRWNLDRCADYIGEHFRKAGGAVSEQRYEVDGKIYRNVIASFGPAEGERLVVGAHYDACGETPGADDNASVITSYSIHYTKLYDIKGVIKS